MKPKRKKKSAKKTIRYWSQFSVECKRHVGTVIDRKQLFKILLMCKHICRVCGCTIWSVLSDDGYSLARVLQCGSGLLVCGHTQIHAVYLSHTHEGGVFMTTAKALKQLSQRALTLRIWSPLWSSPLRSAGPPARMKEMKMPSPSSPPTMLNPRPVEPLWIKIRRGSLKHWKEESCKHWRFLKTCKHVSLCLEMF